MNMHARGPAIAGHINWKRKSTTTATKINHVLSDQVGSNLPESSNVFALIMYCYMGAVVE